MEWKYSYMLHATETIDKCRPDVPLGLYVDFTFFIPHSQFQTVVLFYKIIIYWYVTYTFRTLSRIGGGGGDEA